MIIKNNIKRALKRSNKSKIKYAIIIGETEVQNQTYSLKNMINGEQKDISFEELIKTLKL